MTADSNNTHCSEIYGHAMPLICMVSPARWQDMQNMIDPQQLADDPVMSDAAADVLVRVMFGAVEVVPVLLMAMSGA